MVVEWVDGGSVGSGDRVRGVGCGIVVSNISDLRRVEKVRFASSAAKSQRNMSRKISYSYTHSFGSAIPPVGHFSSLPLMGLLEIHRHVVS